MKNTWIPLQIEYAKLFLIDPLAPQEKPFEQTLIYFNYDSNDKLYQADS